MKALIFNAPEFDTEQIVEACENQQLEIQDLGQTPDPEDIEKKLENKSAIIFLPALTEDLAGIKLAQNALAQCPPNNFDGPPRVIALYAQTLPEKEYLCLAFREGVDDIIALDVKPEALSNHISRCRKMLENRKGSSCNGEELKAEIDHAKKKIQNLQLQLSKLEESHQALAATAIRLATGELQFGQSAPVLLIASSSETQGEAAVEIARHIGFETHLTHSGAAAIEVAQEKKPQVILTDGTLPDMEATQLAKSLRKSLGNHPTVIIAWSSNPELEAKLLSPSGGLDDFVLKTSGRKADTSLAAALLAGLH